MRSTAAEVERAFNSLVNMTPEQIAAWLDTEESKSVGFVRAGERESVGRQSARRIAGILSRGVSSEADVAHMRKVVGYIKRHRAQRPSGSVRNTRWRYSLMNWGHDPLGRGEL